MKLFKQLQISSFYTIIVAPTAHLQTSAKAISETRDGREGSGEVSIALACQTFEVSGKCYRDARLLSDENAEIAEWLDEQSQDVGLWIEPQARVSDGRTFPEH